MSTYVPNASEVRNDWYLIDAKDKILGRLATRAAVVLMGKHKPDYTPFLKTGDHVVVINAEKIAVTGGKDEKKVYRRHSGYPGGLRETKLRNVRRVFPARVVEDAILGMLPKSVLGKQLRRRLRVYAGPDHPHQAQNPKSLEF